MKYLQFLKKMTDANGKGGVDSLWQSLKNDERNYLFQNEARLSVLGGEKIFLQQLAEKFDVDTAGASDLEVKERIGNAINDLVEDARRRVQSNYDNQEEKEQAKLVREELISDQRFSTYMEAFSAVLSRGDGKSWEVTCSP